MQRKSEMKKIFRENNINVAQGLRTDNIEEVKKLISAVGYPIIAKPDIGVGAEGTTKLNNDEQLKIHFEKRAHNPVDWFYEEFLEGDLWTFDGIADHDGKVVFYDTMKYNCGVMETVTKNLTLAYTIMREIPPQLREFGLKAAEAFKMNAQFFHLEFFFRKKDNQFYALEANLRPPGGYTLDMMNFAFDRDMFDEWANVVYAGKLPEKPGVSAEPKYYCSYVSRKNSYNYKHSHDEIMARYGPSGSNILKSYRPMPVIFSKVMGDFFYTYRVTTLEESIAIQEFIEAQH